MKNTPKPVSYIFILLGYGLQIGLIELLAPRSLSHGNPIPMVRTGWFIDSAIVIATLGSALAIYEVNRNRIKKARCIFFSLILIPLWWGPISIEIFDYFLWQGL